MMKQIATGLIAASRNGSVTCDPSIHSRQGSRTTTGPNGGTAYREGEVRW